MSEQKTPYTLYFGDCFEQMRNIPDGSVSMLLVDEPYAVLNKGNKGAQWDRELPHDKLWPEILRVCKPNAAMVFFGQGMITARIMMSRPKLWRYNLIWNKVIFTGFLNANRMPMRQHEDIMVFYRSLPTYNPQFEKGTLHKRGWVGGLSNCYGNFVRTEGVITDERYPGSIITFSSQNRTYKKYHPSAKPVELLRWLIRTYSNEGDTILDYCMGSGSTCVAALMENRRTIGIEREEKFFQIAQKRIEEIISTPPRN